MKKTFLAMAVLAVGLPSLAFAGEPVPMTDDDLDSVAAGVSLQALLSLSESQVAELKASDDYKVRSAGLVKQYGGLSSYQKEQLAAKIGKLNLSESERGKLIAIAPKELQHLLNAPSAQ